MDDITPPDLLSNTEEIGPALSFLAQASAKHHLVERNFLPVDEAIGELIPPFSDLVGFPVCDVCGARPCINPSFCGACRKADRLRKAPSAEIKLLRSLLRDDVSFAAAVAQIERRRGRR